MQKKNTAIMKHNCDHYDFISDLIFVTFANSLSSAKIRAYFSLRKSRQNVNLL